MEAVPGIIVFTILAFGIAAAVLIQIFVGMASILFGVSGVKEESSGKMMHIRENSHDYDEDN
jgi:hypothetical protein|tara:strand:- start:329 stop:514 length:186 start_codon:yes stop_codon:yes gene_type:complete